MKIQLDTIRKTIKIEENIKVSKLLKTLKKLLPNDWKDFMLETNTTIKDWFYPIYIEQYPKYPFYPWISTKGNTTAMIEYSLKPGVFNIEI